MNEIHTNPKWGFELIENEGNVFFQIETLNGPRLIPQELVISAFFKTMKSETESFIGTELKEISLLIDFKLNESQKQIFQKGAAKNNLKIKSIDFC